MTFDKVAARRLLARWTGGRQFPEEAYDYLLDALAECVIPVPGAALTRDQAALAIRWYTRLPIPVTAEDVELANHLKEATA